VRKRDWRGGSSGFVNRILIFRYSWDVNGGVSRRFFGEYM